MPATYLDSQNATRDDLDLGTFRTGEGQHQHSPTVRPGPDRPGGGGSNTLAFGPPLL